MAVLRLRRKGESKMPRKGYYKDIDIVVENCLIQVQYNVFIKNREAMFVADLRAIRRCNGVANIFKIWTSPKWSDVRQHAMRAVSRKDVFSKTIGSLKRNYHYYPESFDGYCINFVMTDGSHMGYWIPMKEFLRSVEQNEVIRGFLPTRSKVNEMWGQNLEDEDAMRRHLAWRKTYLEGSLGDSIRIPK